MLDSMKDDLTDTMGMAFNQWSEEPRREAHSNPARQNRAGGDPARAQDCPGCRARQNGCRCRHELSHRFARAASSRGQGRSADEISQAILDATHVKPSLAPARRKLARGADAALLWHGEQPRFFERMDDGRIRSKWIEAQSVSSAFSRQPVISARLPEGTLHYILCRSPRAQSSKHCLACGQGSALPLFRACA